VPNFVGQKWNDIMSNADNGKFRIVQLKSDFSDNFADGVVMSQDVPPYTEVPAGAPVGLIISEGAKTRAIPNIIGQSIDAASTTLEAAGLKMGAQTEEYNSAIPFGCVIDISGAKLGDKLQKGSLVAVRVSLGATAIE
ncbi:MAG: PASTA domain-containing protein, partial [Oscillospiraceae bacterium]|nr:PASTA domain-containing protein [Oscillospiraceae bacterium]